MAINNLNPRRTVWFSPNEPSNKYDIWLSRNAHLDENGEPTTDSTSQRGCDYIFKIYDCGKWNPIVGFNSTAANKIDIVEGNTLYHPAIFTGENPNDLYDAGSLGDLLNNTNFVTPENWESIYSTYLKTIIEHYPFNLWHAESNRLGGIWADRFTQAYSDTSTANETYLAQAKYKYQLVANDYNLYVHAKDIIDVINTYQTENPNSPGIQPGGDFELWLANTLKIGGIKADVYSSANDTRLVEVKLFPVGDLKFERLSVDANEIITKIGESLEEDDSLFFGSHGVTIQNGGIGDNKIYWSLDHLSNAEAGKFPQSVIGSGGRMTLQWVDIPAGTTYTSGTLIDVDNTDDTIGIDASGASDGDVIICDDGVAKWANAPQTNIISLSVDCGGYYDVLINGNYIEFIVGNVLEDRTEINSWNRYILLNYKGFLGFINVEQNNNPIYISIDALYSMTVVADGTTENVIDSGGCLTGSSVPAGNYLFTLQFGAIKIEQIQAVAGNQSSPAEPHP